MVRCGSLARIGNVLCVREPATTQLFEPMSRGSASARRRRRSAGRRRRRDARSARILGAHVARAELRRCANAEYSSSTLSGNVFRSIAGVRREDRLAALEVEQLAHRRLAPIAFIARRIAPTSSVRFDVSAWCREMTTAGVQRPGLMPSIVNSIGSSVGVRSVSRDVGVDAAHERFDDRLAARVVVIELGVEIAAEHVQARADVALELARPEDLGDGAGRLPPPQLELEQPILRGGVALREKQVRLVLRVDVVDAPPVAHDLDRLRQPRRPAATSSAGCAPLRQTVSQRERWLPVPHARTRPTRPTCASRTAICATCTASPISPSAPAFSRNILLGDAVCAGIRQQRPQRQLRRRQGAAARRR